MKERTRGQMRERELREKYLYMLEKGTDLIKWTSKRREAKTSRIRYMRRGQKMTGGGVRYGKGDSKGRGTDKGEETAKIRRTEKRRVRQEGGQRRKRDRQGMWTEMEKGRIR